MITETNTVSEIKETNSIVQNLTATDEIRRNHLQPQEIKPIANELGVTDFRIKFARLKKALRKRSSNIF